MTLHPATHLKNYMGHALSLSLFLAMIHSLAAQAHPGETLVAGHTNEK
jgi:hypothetical protein